MRRLTLLSIPLMLAWSEKLPAQARPTPLCYHARPKPACSAFVLTNYGSYVVTGDFPVGVVVDWGWMVNVSTRDFEVAVGTPLVGGPSGNSSDDVRGAVFGLVKWSPNQWLAVAARPELVDRPVFFCGGPTNTCTSQVQWRWRVPLGVEFGWVPGLALTIASGVALLTLAAIFAGRHY